MKKIHTLAMALLISVTAMAQDKKEVSLYNVNANARQEIDAAVKQAKKDGKHVLLQVGGNWCTWCIAFHNLVDTTANLKSYQNDHYVSLLVNYSPENKNEAVLASLGYPQRFGFPVFVVLDGDGKVIHTQNSAYLETADVDAKGRKKVAHDPKKVMEFFQGWTYDAVHPAPVKSTK